jgi:membrane-bound inhibitor of C-type lysozyme
MIETAGGNRQYNGQIVWWAQEDVETLYNPLNK